MDDLTSWVERSRAGDASAFAGVVRYFQDRAVAYAAGQLGLPGLAEDAAQEAFLEAWVGFRGLEEPRAFADWFRRLLARQCLRIRRRRGLPAVAHEVAAGHPPRTGQAEADIGAEPGDGSDRMSAALEVLPPGLRTAILLHYVGDLSLAEMAAFLGRPLRVVKTWLLDGRLKLKAAVPNLTGDELRGLRPSLGGAFQAGVLELLAAARAGDALTVRTLLRARPARASARDPLDNTALIAALDGGRRAVVRLLLDAGVRPGYHESAAIGWTRRVGRWIRCHPGAVDRESAEGMTALGYAASFGQLEVVEQLLAAGADPAWCDAAGLRPRDRAANRGHDAVVRRLDTHAFGPKETP